MSGQVKTSFNSLEIGDLFYLFEDGYYELFQLLEINEEFLVKSFWPTFELPLLESAEIKSTCSNFPYSTTCTIYFLQSGQLLETDEREIIQFKRIVEGKKTRDKQFLMLLQNAKNAIALKQYHEAVDLLTEAAPYSKLDVSIYQKRGYCYFHVGKYHEAISDFEYALGREMNMQTLKLCISSYEKIGKIDQANEKRKLLVE